MIKWQIGREDACGFAAHHDCTGFMHTGVQSQKIVITLQSDLVQI